MQVVSSEFHAEKWEKNPSSCHFQSSQFVSFSLKQSLLYWHEFWIIFLFISSDVQRGLLHFPCSLKRLRTSEWRQTGKIIVVELCLGLMRRRKELLELKLISNWLLQTWKNFPSTVTMGECLVGPSWKMDVSKTGLFIYYLNVETWL